MVINNDCCLPEALKDPPPFICVKSSINARELEMASSDEQLSAEGKARAKEYARDSRFSFRNFAEHSMRREMKEEAMEICNAHVKEFAECAQEKGLLVVWSCSKQHKAIKECLAIHNGEEAWERYKERHAVELEQRSKLQGPPRPPPKVPKSSH
jgi:hypothetical protein